MYYAQQSPGIVHKPQNHHEQLQSPWNRAHHPVLGPPGTQPNIGPPPPSPGYAIYSNGNVNSMQHHPGHHPHSLSGHPPMQHHHQNSLTHYPSPPNGSSHQQQQQHILGQGSPSTVPGQMVTPQWQQQLLKYELVRSSRSPHHRARASAMASRTVTKSAIPITNPNTLKSTPEVHDATKDAKTTPDTSPTSNGAVINHPSSTIAPVAAQRRPENKWNSLDMGGVNIKNLPPTSGLFGFTFLLNLYLNHNNLSTIPPEISKLRHLELLDLSGNNLSTLPPELGLLSDLKELYLFDNHLSTIPAEFGTLHQLQTIGIEGNPLDAALKAIVQKDGTQALISYLRDSCPVPDPPPERLWKDLISQPEREALAADPNVETFSIVCYNILCERAATERLYGYTPAWALSWEYRKELILTEVMNYDADIVCLQEVDIAQYEDYFIKHLTEQGYEGVYWPKSRHKTMKESDRRQVDGCATFYKASKYQLVEKQLIEFSAVAMQRQDFKKTDDMFNRVLGKDHMAVVCLLESKESGTRLVIANTHIHWDPAYRDVKLVQVALLVNEVEKMADGFAKYPPRLPPTPSPVVHTDGSDSDDTAFSDSLVLRPPPVYSDGTKIPTIICGDFNSIPESGVYEFLSNGTLQYDHPDFMSHMYGKYTSEGLRHRLGLKSAYAGMGELPITNVTPSFRGAIDHIWYSTANLGVNAVLEAVDQRYLDKVVGFPNVHFPSDHVCLATEFRIKPPRDNPPRPPPVFS